MISGKSLPFVATPINAPHSIAARLLAIVHTSRLKVFHLSYALRGYDWEILNAFPLKSLPRTSLLVGSFHFISAHFNRSHSTIKSVSCPSALRGEDGQQCFSSQLDSDHLGSDPLSAFLDVAFRLCSLPLISIAHTPRLRVYFL